MRSVLTRLRYSMKQQWWLHLCWVWGYGYYPSLGYSFCFLLSAFCFLLLSRSCQVRGNICRHSISFHLIGRQWLQCLQVERDKDTISSRYSVINTPLSETNQWIQSTFLMLLEKSCSSVLLPTYVVFAGKRPGSRSLALSQLQKASP